MLPQRRSLRGNRQPENRLCRCFGGRGRGNDYFQAAYLRNKRQPEKLFGVVLNGFLLNEQIETFAKPQTTA